MENRLIYDGKNNIMSDFRQSIQRLFEETGFLDTELPVKKCKVKNGQSMGRKS